MKNIFSVPALVQLVAFLLLPLNLFAASDDALVVDAQGNVGIGTLTPSTPLHLNVGTGKNGMILISNPTGNAWINLGRDNDSEPDRNELMIGNGAEGRRP